MTTGGNRHASLVLHVYCLSHRQSPLYQ